MFLKHALIKDSRNPLLSDVADDMQIRRTFGGGFDRKESEQVEYKKNDPDSELTRQYERRGQEMRNVGSHRSTGPNVRELNSTPLSDLNAQRSNPQSALEPANYSR